MINLNNYQKTQIILLVAIIIAAIVFIISFVKTRNSQQYSTEETFAEMTDIINETEEETAEEDISEQPEDTSWDEQNVEDTEVDMANEENKQENNTASYYIKVNYTANVVTIYTKNNEGKYTKPVKAMVCSTGTATPRSGVYKMSDKYRWHQLNGGVYGQYCSRITGHILFHSVPYKTNSPDTLKYTSYDKLGTAASAGCIRLTVADALWIYSNCPSGTYVEFYSSSNPGPLGKPTAKKISSNTTCRNWDPTDPLPNNPWHTYVEPTPQKEQQTQTTQNNYQEENKQEETSQNNNNQSNSNQNNNESSNQNNNQTSNGNNNQDNNQKPNEEKPNQKPTTNTTNTSNTTNTTNTTTNTVTNTTNNTTENTVINTTTNTNVNTSSSTKGNTQTTDKTN